MLSDSQIKFLADILNAVGQVSLASLVMPYFTSGLSMGFITTGIAATLTCWIGGLILTKDIK